MGFTGAHVLYTFDAFILALYLLFHGCALLKYTCKPVNMSQENLQSSLAVAEELQVKGRTVERKSSTANLLIISTPTPILSESLASFNDCSRQFYTASIPLPLSPKGIIPVSSETKYEDLEQSRLITM